MFSLNDTYPLLFGLALGLILGSFFNVLIYRLPRGVSIAAPRSFCPNCKSWIAWYDNIPVLSYLVLGGRCRRCRWKIPLIYPTVESLSGVLGALTFCRYGLTVKAIWVYAFLAILLLVTFIDWLHRIIPDVLSLGGVALGWMGSFFYLNIGPRDSFLGALVGSALLIVIALTYRAIRRVDGLGGGDIKLMAMIGAFLGWKMIFPILFLASFFGSLYGVYLIRSGGSGKTAVAFGSFLAPSAYLVFFFGGRLWELYLRLCLL